MALDLGLTTHQLLSTLDGVVERALDVPADKAAFRTAAVGRRPYISARTGSEGLLGSRPPPEVPHDWTAISVDGSHIDVDRHLINLGGCIITYGRDFGCQLFSEPTLAVDDADLYLRSPDGARGETLTAGPLLGALRTVREVERLADAVESLPDDRPVLVLLDGTLAFWDLQRGQYPRYVADLLIGERLQPALARLRTAATHRRPVAVAAYTSRPRTNEAAGAVRLMLCDQGDADCNRLCTARRSDRASCDAAAGFDDREVFDLLLEPGHRSPLYRSSHLAARFALGLATGQEWIHFYYLNGGSEIACVEVPDWLAQDPELLALSHAMLVKQCQLGLGYPVAISEAHEQAVITGHDREVGIMSSHTGTFHPCGCPPCGPAGRSDCPYRQAPPPNPAPGPTQAGPGGLSVAGSKSRAAASSCRHHERIPARPAPNAVVQSYPAGKLPSRADCAKLLGRRLEVEYITHIAPAEQVAVGLFGATVMISDGDRQVFSRRRLRLPREFPVMGFIAPPTGHGAVRS